MESGEDYGCKYELCNSFTNGDDNILFSCVLGNYFYLALVIGVNGANGGDKPGGRMAASWANVAVYAWWYF